MLLKKRILLLFIVGCCCFCLHASHKVYLLHGYIGWGGQMLLIERALNENHIDCEAFSYPSLKIDIDSVGRLLYEKIKLDGVDSVSFVTHSMGALVVRSMYNHVETENAPFFPYRFVMIAPPNQGSPVADFFTQFKFATHIGGPNLYNLTTDKTDGAPKYPIPSCEIGLISAGLRDDIGYNIFMEGNNDGLVVTEHMKLGTEKDVVYIKDTHAGLLINEKAIKCTVNFLKYGRFVPINE